MAKLAASLACESVAIGIGIGTVAAGVNRHYGDDAGDLSNGLSGKWRR